MLPSGREAGAGLEPAPANLRNLYSPEAVARGLASPSRKRQQRHPDQAQAR